MKENFSSEKFWNNDYWAKNLELNRDKEKLDFTEDAWLEQYRDTFNQVKRGKALDLGCGLGQDTMFLFNEGFEVISTDISEKALSELKKKCPNADTIQLDMTNPLPFEDEKFDLVFANLSTHYYNWEDTVKLYNEIRRILKTDGYFIGRVNSNKTMKNDVNNPELIEDNYYFDKRYLRYFTKDQFDKLLIEWNIIVLNETTTNRWERVKTLWEFILKK